MELAGELFGVLLMRLEQGQSALQQCLQLRILGIRNECTTERGVDSLVIRHLVIDVSLVESRSVEGGKLVARDVGLLGQGLAGRIVLRRDV